MQKVEKSIKRPRQGAFFLCSSTRQRRGQVQSFRQQQSSYCYPRKEDGGLLERCTCRMAVGSLARLLKFPSIFQPNNCPCINGSGMPEFRQMTRTWTSGAMRSSRGLRVHLRRNSERQDRWRYARAAPSWCGGWIGLGVVCPILCASSLAWKKRESASRASPRRSRQPARPGSWSSICSSRWQSLSAI